MINVNKFIFYEICNKNIDNYNDLITSIKCDYFKNINLLKNNTDCQYIRQIIHTLIGIISLLNNTNMEINYILMRILNINKNSADYYLYKDLINELILYNKNNLF